MLLKKKNKSIFVCCPIEGNGVCYVRSFPMLWFRRSLQSELCVCEQRALSDQPGSHPARTQQCQDHFSLVTACLWRHSTDNFTQREGCWFQHRRCRCWCSTIHVLCKNLHRPRAGKEPLSHSTWGGRALHQCCWLKDHEISLGHGTLKFKKSLQDHQAQPSLICQCLHCTPCSGHKGQELISFH